MKREIKFRGLTLATKEMIYGLVNKSNQPAEYDDIISNYRIASNGENIFVIPETIGQFTGLHDKNGKEIFEGDIVECKKTTSKFSYKFTSVVTMQYGCFGVITDRFIALKDLIEGNIKVIGNVFENANLVKL